MLNTLERKKSYFLGLSIILTIIFLMALGPLLGLQSIVTYGLIPFLAIIGFTYDIKTFHKKTTELKLFFGIVILALLTIFYNNIDFEAFGTTYFGLLGAFIAAYATLSLNKNNPYENYFHIGFVLAIIALILIEFNDGNISLVDFATSRDRRRFMLNANFYSYASYFGNISLFYLYLKQRNKIVLVSLVILPILFIIVAFATQSRSGILFIVLSNISFWLVICRTNNKNIFLKIFKAIGIVIIIYFLALQFIAIYENSEFKNRVSNSSGKADAREILVIKGWEVFENNPFIGVGTGQFPRFSGMNQFTHNSYVEILAENGLFSGILLFLMFGIPTYISLKNLITYPKNELFRLNFFFFITFLMYNNAYVFYKFSFSMIYFFLIISTQNKASIEDKNKIQS
ncbi:O-antigen ligase family protein [Arenibacter sp. S6351L]|uniref:O-antigen ligase family protein n=1 Tax=Arenibacter sp. S6351L TaxID=2926407 RepID=UPI001FF205F9|nr:O-antigen ligase family protein [Arenibacter sp. S6351L]MCK0136978.1 O-antigen ligase family protein [Arenibacter sp. S6351L]